MEFLTLTPKAIALCAALSIDCSGMVNVAQMETDDRYFMACRRDIDAECREFYRQRRDFVCGPMGYAMHNREQKLIFVCERQAFTS